MTKNSETQNVCKKCNGKRWYKYDDCHSKFCEYCCKHDQGYWLLPEGYTSAGNYCCNAGCGHTITPKEFKKVSNSTQNDEIKQMERAINEGFAESEKFLKGMKTPFDKSSTQNDEIEVDGETYVKWDTQNDWDKRFDKRFPLEGGIWVLERHRNEVRNFIAKELADARREVIANVIKKIKKMKVRRKLPNVSKEYREMSEKYALWEETVLDNVLATLKEETL